MKRVIFLLFFIFCISAHAQEIKVKSLEMLPSDLSARTNVRLDSNGTPCALVKVSIPMVKDMLFSGWVIGDVNYHPGEYWVYVPEGTKKIKFQHENYTPGEIVFTMPIEKQCVYRVILDVPEVTKFATECTAFVTEGGRLYSLREYDNAKKAYENAINSKDVPLDMKPVILSDMSQCDSCLLYEQYAMGALGKMKELRNSGDANQAEVVKYASAALEFLNVLDHYNPNDFYKTRIERLGKIIEDMPLEIRFTVVSWVKTYSGFFENGGLGNVEVWAYYGEDHLAPSSYETEKAFRNLTSSESFSQIGVTDNEGVVDLKFNRKNLPTMLVFRPVGYDKKIKTSAMDMINVLNDSKGSYNKRQFRLKMYVENKSL